VQYQQNGGPTWSGWLTQTTQTSAVFMGSSGYTYTFRVRGRDVVGNLSDWAQAEPVVASVTKYYSFGSQRVAMGRGSVVYYLITRHQDVAICFCHELHEFLLNLSLFRVNSCNSWLKICALLVNVG
jgi:hypothetical protein